MVAVSDVPSIPLSHGGKSLPVVGLGTWKSDTGKVKMAVEAAIDAGYRHIDCAFCYGNEKEVGEGIKAKIDDGTVKREELFITTKIWNTFHRKDMVAECLKKSLEDLGLEYVDLTLVHWPMAFKDGFDRFPKDDNGKFIYSDSPLAGTWEGMEGLVSAGLSKAIGVSNFNSKQLQMILDTAKITPVCNQVECHPWFNQKKLIEFCKEKGVVFEAYSPLGSPDRPWATKDDPILMEDPVLKEIADKHGKSVAQICVRFQVQRGVVVLPKSVTPARISSNIEVFDFQLSDEEMTKIESLDKGKEGRSCHLSWVADHPDFPFNEEF